MISILISIYPSYNSCISITRLKINIPRFKFIFNKQNASNPYIRWILATIQLHAASGHQEGYGHKHICFNDIYFFWDDIFLHDNWNGCKFYFFDMKYMSDPRLIEWISKIDDRWKGVSLSHQNETSADPEKNELKEIARIY